MEILVFPTLEDLSRKAAEIFVDISRACIISKGKFTVAVSGGSTPRRLYALLGSDSYREKIDWSHVYFFWVDERCVPKEHGDSNYGLVFKILLSKLAMPDENIRRMKGEMEPEKAARAYEEDLRTFFGKSALPAFDLILLGIGKDGHTASLFPDSETLGETDRLVVPVFIEKQQKQRITLTLPVLNNGSQVIILASGSAKADIIQELLGRKDRAMQYPSCLVQPIRDNVLWLIDEEAAKKLKR
jgi:6-phosphogluconolactonase